MVGMKTDELRAFLGERGADEALAHRVATFVERCERARFAGGEERAESAVDLVEEAKELVVAVDRVSSSTPKGGRS